MQRQLQAAYFSDVLMKAIRIHYKDKAISVTKELLNSLSFFETDLPERSIVLDKTSLAYSLLSVYHNYILRGLPTHASVLVEEYLKDTWGNIEAEISDTGSLEYSIKDVDDEFTKKLFSSLFIVDARVKDGVINNSYWKSVLGSNLERRFVLDYLLPAYGTDWLQLIEPQRSVANILSYSYQSGEYIRELYNQPIDSMGEQRVDFAVELPCVFTNEGRRGLVLEIDGSQHLNNRAQFNLDQYRDQALLCLENTKWATIRARSAEWNRVPTLLNNFDSFFKDRYFEKIKQNYTTPIWNEKDGVKALNLALTPIAVARIQITLIELIFNGILSFKKDVWKIGIVERDVDCAKIAIEDIKDSWNRFNELSGGKNPLPEIELTVYSSAEFMDPNKWGYKRPVSEASAYFGDLMLDVSVLQRWGLSETIQTNQTVYTVTIRSAHSKKSIRSFLSAPLITYEPLIEIKDSQTDLYWDKIRHINYFVQSVFRKKSLRAGQLPIINKALQLSSVIGLLPTGGGKSLTYQICALLQPGVTIVIDPIKSLMVDQNAGLLKGGIDATVFINSSIKTFYGRKWAQDQIQQGRVLFAFVSPERLQIPGFRSMLATMNEQYDKYFSYCVIDEAHCVSEWGHDFRTSYLKLGDNARLFCKTWGGKKAIPLFGLTATASFDVLSDVKRELKIGDENVVSSLSAHRKELLYQIHPVKTGLRQGANGFQASQTVGNAKVEKLKTLLNSLPDNILSLSDAEFIPKNFNRIKFYKKNEKDKHDNAVLIFCPHKSGNSPMGVDYAAPRISQPDFTIGTFYGADDRLDDVSISEVCQEKYLNNDLNILVATKAFGMGIDKANIRATFHYNFPSSIEAFVQEAGRAGRDRKRGICHILYSEDARHIDESIITSFHENNFKGIQHDFEMLLELLEEISYPAQKMMNQISQLVLEDLGEVVQIKIWRNGNNVRLYVNRAFQVGYGYIDLRNLSALTQNVHADIGVDLASSVLNYIVDFIRNNCPGNDYANWLESELINNTQPGIERLFKRIQSGEELPEIEVAFRNNRINLITQLLKDNVDEEFTEYLVEKASDYCSQIDKFYENLNKEFRKSHNRDTENPLPIPNSQISSLVEKYFYQIRSEIDTFKAIYRLSVLGVIDDYEVDYASKSVKLKIRKKRDEQYLHRLEDYLIRYLSPKRVGEMMEIVKNGKRGSVIRNCAYALIEYVYRFIGSKRARAIKEMQSVCEIGISNPDPDEVERTIALYFNSKYTEDLLEKTQDGVLFNIEIVQEYIDETQGVSDNLEHLRGSAARILTDNPDNAALLVLRSYAALLLETRFVRGHLEIRSQFLVDKALEDLEAGLIKFKEGGFNLMEVLNMLRKELLTQNPGLSDLLEEVSILLSVKQHSLWVKNFNNQFIESI